MTTTQTIPFGDAAIPVVGAVALVDADVFDFDTLAEAEAFAAAFGGSAFAVVDIAEAIA